MIQFSLGTGDNLGKSKNTKETFKKFRARYALPHVTPEKWREYKDASDKRQRTLKGSNGWMMRNLVSTSIGDPIRFRRIKPNGTLTTCMFLTIQFVSNNYPKFIRRISNKLF